MCGVIGAFVSKPSEENFDTLKKVFEETEIRGLHASGVSYIKNNEVHTDLASTRARQFISDKDFSEYVNEDGNLYMIGHTRYSTSDLRYNQPIANGNISIVHNGVVSQEDPSTWKYKTRTRNDSELILHSLQHGNNPMVEFPESSQATCVLWKSKNGSPCVMGYRNGKRPLWVSKDRDYVIFTSTEDIAKRSRLRNTEQCVMGNYYLRDNNSFIIDNESMSLVDMEDIQ